MRHSNSGKNRYFMIAAAIVAALVIGFALGRTGTAPKHKRPVPAKKTIRPVPAAKKPLLPKITKNFSNPMIAIVIDDFGYNTNNLEKFLDIGEPITLSILPNQRYSVKVAEAAHSRGYETILHLPLEPKDSAVREEPGTIKGSMNDGQIISRLKEDLGSMPYLDGVSNHMGSKGTEDRHLMSVIFAELKKRKLFFFDSLTSSSSICGEVARSVGIRCARRDVFLDIPDDPPVIEKRILETRRLAFKKGFAIAVGHDKHNTVTALSKYMPAMAAEGVRFVRISELER